MDGILLDSSYTWTEARNLGVTRAQVRDDGEQISPGLYVSRSAEPDPATLCRAWTRVLPADAAFGFEAATALHGAGAFGRSPAAFASRRERRRSWTWPRRCSRPICSRWATP